MKLDGLSSRMVWPPRWMTPFMFPPGEMGTASFDRPAGTLNVLESAAVADVESVTVEGAVVRTTAHTRSSN